jgi:hypothetical protein
MVISRQPSAVDSQGTEYGLTPLGESLRPILESLIEWGIHHATELDETHRLLPCEAVIRVALADQLAAYRVGESGHALLGGDWGG